MWINEEKDAPLDKYRVAQYQHGDQFCYLLVCPETRRAIVVDPGDPAFLQEIATQDVQVSLVINTHGHWDHDSGNTVFVKKYGCKIARYGSGDKPLQDGSTIDIGSLHLKVLYTPGHTDDSICLLGGGFLFSGDTLFIASCGNAFGDQAMEQMYQSLKRIGELDPAVQVCCGHNYAQTALQVALEIDSDNSAAQKKLAQIKAAAQPLTSTLRQELQYNPFLRLDTPELGAFLQRRLGQQTEDPKLRFFRLRELRNRS